jgi:hypothetical protein
MRPLFSHRRSPARCLLLGPQPLDNDVGEVVECHLRRLEMESSAQRRELPPELPILPMDLTSTGHRSGRGRAQPIPRDRDRKARIAIMSANVLTRGCPI